MNHRSTILLVEDDQALRAGLAETLELEGYVVVTAASGLECFQFLAKSPNIQLAVVDLGLPDIDGMSIVRHLSSDSSVGCIVLTATSERQAPEESYRIGADIYLRKPIDLGELVGAVNSVLRRLQGEPWAKGDQLVEQASRDALWLLSEHPPVLFTPVDEIRLNTKEVALLKSLLHAGGKPVSRDLISLTIYGREDSSAVAALTTLASRLRSKVYKETNELLLASEYGVGYYLTRQLAQT